MFWTFWLFYVCLFCICTFFEGNLCFQIISNPSLAGTEGAAHSAYQRFENLRNFLMAIDELRLPTFEASDLEQAWALCFC